MVRTRFAPSPTGYLHIGGARTALFSWAFARRHSGKFILRIEDTDLERSTGESVKAILDGMKWLRLDYDEGPYYQMQRLPRYGEAAQKLLDEGKAYYCYASREELEEMREQQRANGLKPRYDGRWRDSAKTPPAGVKPVVRFKNPLDGEVVFDDLIKGQIVVQNGELDDLVLLRANGTPTYNFGVVVDDLDMQITHVIRGDDHVNNTPRQINILKAMGASLPQYAHVPMILGADGERLSKRHGAVSVMQYCEEGYLPEALLNYLARLGWSHGDEEVFSLKQFVEWFDLSAISKSPAKFDPEKLRWLNQQYLKKLDNKAYAESAKPFYVKAGLNPEAGPELEKVVELYKERSHSLSDVVALSMHVFRVPDADDPLVKQYVTAEIKPLMVELAEKFSHSEWNQKAIHEAISQIASAHNLGFGKVAMPLRVMVTGKTQTAPIDAELALMGRDEVLRRMRQQLKNFPG